MAPIRLLLLEDVESDAELVKRALRKAGLDSETRVVWTAADFERELTAFAPQVIVSDFAMPQFNAPAALRTLRERKLDIPFILYTGTQSEETAVEIMKQGADDYLLKSSLTRLPSAILNALEKRASQKREVEAIEALRKSEQSFRALIEGTPDAIAVLHDGLITYANPALTTALGFDPGHTGFLGKRLCEFSHPDDRDKCQSLFDSIQAGQGVSEPIETRFVRKEGGVIIGETAGIRIVYHGVPAVAVIIRDVTERRQMQAQLLLADRLATVGTLAAGVAHEINNPLGYMTTNLQLLDEELSDLAAKASADSISPSQIAAALNDLIEPLRIIRRGGDRVKNIVRDLMTFSRADREGKAPVDVREVLEFTLKIAGGEIKRRARVEREFGDVPKIEVNESRLSQVFLNLLINAAQAIPPGAADKNFIRITAAAHDGEVVVKIADSGPGISAAIQNRIFDPFFTTKPVGEGTGLGLSISHSLVTGMGGRLAVSSEPGKGATFIVAFPNISYR